MGMTIDTAITVLGMIEAHGICIEAKDVAVETMRKYQNITEIVTKWHNDLSFKTSMAMTEIEEVIEDGKID